MVLQLLLHYQTAEIKLKSLIPFGLNFINKIRPVEFTWQRHKLEPGDVNHINNGKRKLGFIAQEFQEAMPNGENEILDLVYDSNPKRIEAKYGNLIPIS